MGKFRMALLLPLLAAVALSCNDDDERNDVNVNHSLYDTMLDNYLWYKDMPAVDPDTYASPVELMEALRVNPPDRWSYVATRTELEAYFNQGTYVGFGYGAGFNPAGELLVSFVFRNSPLHRQGIGRGWQITSIDGQTPTQENYSSLVGPSTEGVSRTFEFKSPSGATHRHTFAKTAMAINTVLVDTVYTFGSQQVGYFALQSFVSTTQNELDLVFAKFKSRGVTELVVDLRYNGGGEVKVSRFLANLIGGSVAYGKVYAKSFHNDRHIHSNNNLLFGTESGSLPLSRVTFITSRNSASASELVINGLKPFLEVTLVGRQTHGKPVGMYVFTFRDPRINWAFVPVCFTMRNANNEGDFYEGIPVNVEAEDDVKTPLGDVTEASLNAALRNLGVALPKALVQGVDGGFSPLVGKGLRADIGAW